MEKQEKDIIIKSFLVSEESPRDYHLGVRLHFEEGQVLKRLTERWHCSKSELIRALLRWAIS